MIYKLSREELCGTGKDHSQCSSLSIWTETGGMASDRAGGWVGDSWTQTRLRELSDREPYPDPAFCLLPLTGDLTFLSCSPHLVLMRSPGNLESSYRDAAEMHKQQPGLEPGVKSDLHTHIPVMNWILILAVDKITSE